MDVLGSKLVSMFVLGFCSIFFGTLPLIIRRCCVKPDDGDEKPTSTQKRASTRTELFMSGITCFGGGVILTTALTHMLPEVNLLLESNIKHGQFPKTDLPMAEILMLCGFFMIYLVEEFTHAIIEKCHKKKAPEPERPLTFEMDNLKMTEEANPMIQQHPGHQSKGHGHSHGPSFDQTDSDDSYFQAVVRGFLIVLALSLHEIFEGVALGLFSDQSSVWFLFLAISFHKYVISFCLGMQFISSGIKTWLVILYVSTFSLVTVVGAGIGIALAETVQSESSLQSPLVTILQGLATGTLLYVAFFEVLEKERQNETSGIFKMGFIILGFLAMVLFEMILLMETPKSFQEEVIQKLDLGSQPCVLESLPKDFRLPLNLTCTSDGFLVPLS